MQITPANIKANEPELPLTIHGQSGILDGLGVLAFGVLFLCFASHHPVLFVVSGLILISFGFLLLLMAIPQLGKPLLILTREGFETPGFGFIPWNAVQGIDKQEFTHRGLKMSPFLTYYVPDLQSFTGQFHLIHRRLHHRKQITLVLRRSDIKPEIILTLSRKLWTQNTGRDHTWRVSAPEKVNEAYRRISETMARQETMMESMGCTAEEKDYVKAEAIYKQIQSDIGNVESDWKTIKDDVRKSRRLVDWVAALSVLLLIAMIVSVIMDLLR